MYDTATKLMRNSCACPWAWGRNRSQGNRVHHLTFHLSIDHKRCIASIPLQDFLRLFQLHGSHLPREDLSCFSYFPRSFLKADVA